MRGTLEGGIGDVAWVGEQIIGFKDGRWLRTPREDRYYNRPLSTVWSESLTLEGAFGPQP